MANSLFDAFSCDVQAELENFYIPDLKMQFLWLTFLYKAPSHFLKTWSQYIYNDEEFFMHKLRMNPPNEYGQSFFSSKMECVQLFEAPGFSKQQVFGMKVYCLVTLLEYRI